MQIRFVRSGGFAGRATNVEGIVTFEDDTAKVTAAPSYERDVPEQEAALIRQAADPARLAAAKSGKPGPSRDAYQYEVTIEDDNGHGQTFTVSPSAENLGDWVQKETERIWSHRLKNR